MACLDSPKDGVLVMKQGLENWERTASVTYKTYYLGLLAEVLLKEKEYPEAKAVVKSALKLAADTHEYLYLGKLQFIATQLAAL